MPLQPVPRPDTKRSKKKSQPPPNPERLAYTLPEAAHASTYSLSTLYAAIRAGQLKVSRAGRAVRILPEDLEAWMRSTRTDYPRDLQNIERTDNDNDHRDSRNRRPTAT
jgi:excisionase family DNA binding protein